MNTAEEIAKEFHRVYELHARVMGYPIRRESAVPWEDLPEINRSLMISVVESLLVRTIIEPGPSIRE
jgi:hypothetical protein